MFFTTILSILLLVAMSSALPTNAQSLIVFSPRITSPKASITWRIGSTHNVTWDTTNIPRRNRGSTGLILLGHSGNGSENLNTDHPLASSFPIQAGCVTVTMPKNVPPRDDYFIVLFGDSGNKSPTFRISKH